MNQNIVPPSSRSNDKPQADAAFLLSPIREPNNRGIILKQLPEALSEGFRAGVSGGAAMCAQITTFMWLHTIMRYQFRHGSGVLDTIKALYHDGGFLRFYRGYGFAIMYAPLIRGGSTASNQASLTFLESINSDIPLWIKTLTSASCAALWKVTFTPLDMMQTTLQVGGSVGQKDVANKIKKHGLTILWHGSSALYVSALVGNFSWFAVYNSLNRSWSNHDTLKMQTLRDGSIGVLSTLTSDVSTNFLEVLKTHRQTTRNSVGYVQALSEIVGSDGLVGLVTRGLKVRLLTNCCQGAFFTIVWGKIQRRCFPLHLKPTTSE
eukprot:jgi/Bigna1/70128/fgenesh1_pg.11_\